MKIYNDTKIYVVCIGNFHSGGPELCHQLASQLLKFGLNAYMYYIDNNENFSTEDPVDSFYKKYHLPYVWSIEDHSHNILILSETNTFSYDFFKNIQKVIWWMSVDNYVRNIYKILLKHSENPIQKPMPKFFYFERNAIEHWVQSEYARQFLKINGIPQRQIYEVEDYLNQAFLSNVNNIDLSKKENIVVFNPLKGAEITERLIEISNQMTFNMGGGMSWIAIENMTPEQVQELLARAKVYIDFGNHPGKDRIPREAAISGCVVITGKRGAAANDIDINIPAEFKYDETNADLENALEKIYDVFKNFEENHSKQQDYRKRILDDKPRFEKQVALALNIKPKRIDFLAIAQGLSEKGVIFINILIENNVVPQFIIDDSVFDVPDNEFIKTINNEKYFFPESLKNLGIMIISTVDAKFLYAEGRINKISLMNPTDDEINSVAEKFSAKPEDIFIIEV